MQKESFYAFYILLFGRMNKIRIFAKSNHDYSNDHYYFLVMKFYDRENEQQVLSEMLQQST